MAAGRGESCLRWEFEEVVARWRMRWLGGGVAISEMSASDLSLLSFMSVGVRGAELSAS